MKISIKNFGPISDYEFDLNKDFHLIVGKNSVGKSYAMEVVYSVVKAFLHVNSLPLQQARLRLFLIEQGEYAIADHSDDLEVKEGDSKPASAILKQIVTRFLNMTFVSSLNEYITTTFESPAVLQNQFAEDEVCITIQTAEATFNLSLSEDTLLIRDIEITANYLIKGVRSNRSPRNTNEGRVIYNNVNALTPVAQSLSNEAYRIVGQIANEVFHRCTSIHYLPASRSGLYKAMSSFAQVVASLAKHRFTARGKFELPSLSEPVSDYFIELSSITIDNPRISESRFNAVASEIENEILGGRVEFDSRTKKIFFRPKNTELKLDLSLTSSMVSELAPIVAYLRHIITQPVRSSVTSTRKENKQKPLLIIEEPEAHLHPEVQVQLVEKLVMLSKLGVNIAITSHSNYIFNKVSNLIIRKELPIDQVSATLFSMKGHGSSGVALSVSEHGIDDEIFVDISESLFNEKVEAIEKI